MKERREMEPPCISISHDPIRIGRSGGSDVHVKLADTSVSGRHATLVAVGDGTSRIRVEDHDSRYGTFINGQQVRIAMAGVDDLVRFGKVITYRVTAAGQLILEDQPSGVGGRCTDLELRRGTQCIAADLTFSFEPDSFVGILGPSGCGKTTLLNCLAGLLSPARGEVCIGGPAREERQVQVAFVPQDDEHLPKLLTVRENLEFAARLAVDCPASRIDQVLSQVELADLGGRLTLHLSGGQRKRLSIAFGLLLRPKLLLLDEPTAGLDPATEHQVMALLSRIAQQGTTVVCTTHLTDNLRLCQSLIVLGVQGRVGRLAYFGPPEGMQSHFQCRHLADVYEKLATGTFQPWGSETTPVSNVLASAPTKESSSEFADVIPPTLISGTRRAIHQFIVRCFQRAGSDFEHSHVAKPINQALSIAERALRQVSRDRGLCVTLVLQPLVLGLLTCLTQYRNKYRCLAFFLIVIAIWMGLSNSARLLVRGRSLFVREQRSGLSADAFFWGQTLAQLACGVVQIVLLTLAVRILGIWVLTNAAQPIEEQCFLRMPFILGVAYVAGVGQGLWLSCRASSEATAVAAVPLLIMPQMLLSVVATGFAETPYSDSRTRLFRPIAMIVSMASGAKSPGHAEPEGLTHVERVISIASLFCISRPGTICLEDASPKDPSPIDPSPSAWMVDFVHLILLTALTFDFARRDFRGQATKWRDSQSSV